MSAIANSPPVRRSRQLTTQSGTLPDDHAPIVYLSLVPFAGVLLTLTLVFAVLRPPVTHSLLVDLPLPVQSPTGTLSPVYNRLSVDEDGSLRWNGASISQPQLRSLLQASLSDAVQPALLFDPAANAPYGAALPVLNVVREEGLVDDCFRFANLSRYHRYETQPRPNAPSAYDDRECTRVTHYY